MNSLHKILLLKLQHHTLQNKTTILNDKNACLLPKHILCILQLIITKFITKNYESNKLHNQQNSHKMEPIKNTFQNGYISTTKSHTSACL